MDAILTRACCDNRDAFAGLCKCLPSVEWRFVTRGVGWASDQLRGELLGRGGDAVTFSTGRGSSTAVYSACGGRQRRPRALFLGVAKYIGMQVPILYLSKYLGTSRCVLAGT